MLKKLVKPVLVCVILVGVYALLGFYLVPYLLKTKLPELITQQTHTPATLADAKFNPFKLELTLNGFDLKDQEKQSFVKFASLFVDINGLESLKSLTLVVEQLRSEQLQTRLALAKDGNFNFSALFPPSKDKAPEESSADIPVLIKQVLLNQGTLTWVDQGLKKPETATLTPINLSLSNLRFNNAAATQSTLSTQLQGGGKIDWQLALSLKPITSKGHIEFKSIKAQQLWALLLQDQVNFKLPQGECDLSFNYDLAYPADKLTLTLSDGVFASRKLQFTALDNPKPLISIPELKISGIGFDLVKQAIAIAAIESNAINLAPVSNAAGELNLQALFAPPKAAPTKSPPPAIKKTTATDKPWLLNIAKVALLKLQADYQDLADESPLSVKWGGLDFKLTDTQLQVTEPQLKIQAKTSVLAIQHIDINEFRLKNTSPPLQFKGDALQIDLSNFQLDSGSQPLQITAENGKVRTQNFNLHEQGATPPLINLPELTLNGAKLDLAKQQVNVANLLLNGAKLRGWLNKGGQLNYQALFAEKNLNAKATTAPESIKTSPDSTPWTFSLGELELQNFQFDFQDKTRGKPLDLQLSALNFKAQQLSTQKKQKLPFTLHTKINTGGTLELKGQTVLEPFSADIQATLKNLGLKTFQPYLNDYARVDIIAGALNTSAKITLSQPNTKADLSLHAKGDVHINDLLTRDQVLNKDLIKWQAVKFDHLDFDLTPLKLSVDNILLQKPYARVTIKPDHSLNFDDLIVKQPAQVNPPKATVTTKTAPPQYKVGAITVAGGSSDFSDFSLILPFVVELDELNGAVKRFSSEQKQLTDFNLIGKVFDISPMEMAGKFSPDFSALDIGMHFKGMPLPFISPYMVEFAGYKIEKGKMSLDLLYKINDRKLVAENNLILDQLTLGEKVENPKATSLPLNLAITLLKDSDGKININLPLTGSLDDPQFSVTSLVFDAFVNMLTKVISSPFKALGALAADAAELNQVIFKEGSNVLSDAEQKQLLELAKALTAKPALSIEVKGSAYTKQDWPALQDDALLDQLKALKAAELKANGKNQLAEYVDLSEGDTQRLLADLFIKKFPHLGKRSLFGTPELIGSDQDFKTVAKQQLMAIIPPDNQRLATLAATRARNIAQVLIQKGQITHDRIFILDGNVQPEAPKEGIISELSLTVQ
ncbi:MAG: DUF748 domain-containing protein [Methylococcaceae bacterium]|nr:DUF748 domain-containing protein [Methylococcaceae bacterium]